MTRKSPLQLLRDPAVAEPLMSLILFVLGSSFFTVLVTIQSRDWQDAALFLGPVQAAYFAGLLLGGLSVERLVSRIGSVRSYSAFASLLGSAILCLGLLSSPLAWLPLRFFFGICTAAMYVVIESWLLGYAGESNRGTILSIYMVAFYFSQTFSYLLLKGCEVKEINPFMVAAIFIALSAVPLALGFTRVPPLGSTQKLPFKALLQLAPLGALGCFMGGLVQGGVYALLPDFALDQGYDPAYLQALAVLGGGLFQGPIGWLSDRSDRLRVLLGVSGFLIVPCLAMIPLYSFTLMAYLLSFLVGGLSFALYPLALSQSCDTLEESQITGATAWMLTLYGVGSVITPLLNPLFVAYIPTGLFLFFALCSALLTLACYLFLQRETSQESQQRRSPKGQGPKGQGENSSSSPLIGPELNARFLRPQSPAPLESEDEDSRL